MDLLAGIIIFAIVVILIVLVAVIAFIGGMAVGYGSRTADKENTDG